MSQEVGQLIDTALQLANRSSAQYRTRALYAVDRAVRYFADRMPWPSLRKEETFRSDGTNHFTFPQRVRHIISIGDQERGHYVQPGTQLTKQYPTFTLSGRSVGSWQHSDLGVVPVISAPATDTYLDISTPQSESQIVHVVGLVRDSTASGTPLELYEAQETVYLTGTNATSTNQFAEILKIEKDTLDADQDVLVKYTYNGKPVSRIMHNERAPQYKRVEFLGTPNVGDRFVCQYYTNPEKIVAEDVVLDPAIDSDVILWRVVGDLHWINSEGEAANGAWSKAEDKLLVLKSAQEAVNQGFTQFIPWAPFVDPEDDWS